MTKAAILKLADYRDRMQVESPSIQQMDAEKLAKDSIEVEKKSLTSTDILNKNLKDLAKIIKEQGAMGKVTDKAKDLPFYGGATGAIKDKIEGFKEFFTLRGFLDKTGIVTKGGGSIADKALERKDAKKQYVEDMMKTDPTVRLMGPEKAREVFEKRFDTSQDDINAVQKNEKALEGYRSRGLTEEQIKRSPEFKQKAELEAKLAKSDPRFRGSDTLKGQLTGGTTEKRGSNVVPLFGENAKDTPPSLKTGDDAEAEIENARMMEEQNELLRKIEENTRPGEVKAEKVKPEDGESGGLFGGLIKKVKAWALGFGMAFLAKLKMMTVLIGKGLLAGAKILFSGPVLLKLLTRVFPIAMIVGSVVNGLVDGVKKFIETGSITEALIAGLGGLLSFLTFGLVDAESIKNLIAGFKDLANKYILEPIGNFFNNIKEAFVGFIESIGIPEIGFSVFGKKIKFGPWYPFKSGDKPAEPEAPTETNQGARVAPDSNNAGASSLPENAARIDVSKDKETLNKYAQEEAQKFGRKTPNREDRQAASMRLRAERAGGSAASTDNVKPVSGTDPMATPAPSGKPIASSETVETKRQIKIAGEEVVPGKPLSKKQMRIIAISKSMGNKYPPEIEDQYNKQKLSESTGAPPEAADVATKPPESVSSNQVYNQSAQNEAMKQNRETAAPNIVMAPTNNISNNNQTVTVPFRPRGNDSTVNDYVRRRAVG
jgi:hypothetical protein